MSETATSIAPVLPEPADGSLAPASGPRRIVGVQFRRAAAMIYDFDANGLPLAHGARVVVETDRGEALGWCVGAPEEREPHGPDQLRRVVRLADGGDLERDKHNHGIEREALRFCAERARQLHLPMKLVACEWSHSGEKAAFYFSSDDRVDFRGLVRELAQRYRVRVEMRQLKPREDAKILGAMGPCGRETCCSSWLRAFTPVSIKMAKDQGLALNPQKVSGVCGRLLCCLAYEQETYKELRKGLPRVGKIVQTPKGVGRVMDALVLRRKVRVQLDETREWEDFDPADLKPWGPNTKDEPEAPEADDAHDQSDVLPVEAKSTPAPRPSEPRPAPKSEARPERPPRAERTENRPERPQQKGPPPGKPPRAEQRSEQPRTERTEQPRAEQRPPRPERGPRRPEGQGAPQQPQQQGTPQQQREPRPPKPQQQTQQKPQGQKPQQPKQQKSPQGQKPPPPKPPQQQQKPPQADAQPQGEAKGEGAGAQQPVGRRSRHRRGRGGPGSSGGGPDSGGSMPTPA